MFDITSVLKDMPRPETGPEQITYLQLDQIDPDPNNFYSLEGISELADNIATVGLQQPIRVRPSAEKGRYTIVSGHRRKAACLLIRDGEDDARTMFDQGVPCIIEQGEASEALQELRLIYANSATRVMGPAELSKQAERVEWLLYQLKDEGMEFPGRMRDHVAEACKVSKTKLARLHAIRNNLDPGLLKYFDSGELAEETAYQLQRLPEDIQAAVADELSSGKRKNLPVSNVVKRVNQDLDRYLAEMRCRSHAGGPDCHHKTARILKSIFAPYEWQVCEPDRCCRDCYHSKTCSKACQECKDRRELDKAVEEEQAEKAEKEKAEKQKTFQLQRKRKAKRLLPLIEAAGLKDTDELPGNNSWNPGTAISELRKTASGDFGDKYFYDSDILPTSTKAIKEWADKLHCSVDYLLERTDNPGKAVSESDTGNRLHWATGTPKVPGIYELRVGVAAEETPQAAMWLRMDWSPEHGWTYPNSGAPIRQEMNVYRWVMLPEV